MAQEIQTIRVRADSNCKAVAGSITKSLEAGKTVEVQTIGAGALNQAVKAIAMTRTNVSRAGRDAVTKQGFGDTMIDGKERTLIKQFVSLV